jgi:signal transduction histidine kinase
MFMGDVIAWARERTFLPDGSLAAAVAAVDLCQAAVAGTTPGEPGLTPVAVLLLAGQAVPLAWRHRAPIGTWATVAVLAAGYGIADYPDRLLPLAPLVALYTVLVCRPWPTAALIAALTLGAALASTAAAGDSDAQDYLSAALLVAATTAVARGQRSRRAYLTELESSAEHAERARAAEGRQAVQDERVRIARELHDVVAHHVSMVVVQAEAAAVSAPAEPRAALEAIAETGRGALIELRRLLGVLRTGDGTLALAPQPGIAQLEALVHQINNAGMPVTLCVEGRARPLPPGVDLSVFRIVQEALTNTLRHAGPARADVVVRYRDDCLEVDVIDDGRGADRPGGPLRERPVRPGHDMDGGPETDGGRDADGGHGLVGIRERVGMLGGSLRAGPRAEGGFAVSARLPIRARS